MNKNIVANIKAQLQVRILIGRVAEWYVLTETTEQPKIEMITCAEDNGRRGAWIETSIVSEEL